MTEQNTEKQAPKNGRRKSKHDPAEQMVKAGWFQWPIFSLTILSNGRITRLAVTKAMSGFDLFIEDQLDSTHSTLDELQKRAEAYRESINGRIVRNKAGFTVLKSATGMPVDP